MTTCAGTNQDGSSCSNPPVAGSAYCHLHQDQGEEGARGSQPRDPVRTFVRLVFAGVVLAYLLIVVIRCEGGWMLE